MHGPRTTSDKRQQHYRSHCETSDELLRRSKVGMHFVQCILKCERFVPIP